MKKIAFLIILCVLSLSSYAQNNAFLAEMAKFADEQTKLKVKIERMDSLLRPSSSNSNQEMKYYQKMPVDIDQKMVIYILYNRFYLTCNEKENIIEFYQDNTYTTNRLDIYINYMKDVTEALEKKYKSKFSYHSEGKNHLIDVYELKLKDLIIKVKIGILSKQNKVFFSTSYERF